MHFKLCTKGSGMGSLLFVSRQAFTRIVSTIAVAITAFMLLSASASAQIFRVPVITTVAGDGSYYYSGDGGAATSAALANPSGVAVDSAGNLCIADFSYNAIFGSPTALLSG